VENTDPPRVKLFRAHLVSSGNRNREPKLRMYMNIYKKKIGLCKDYSKGGLKMIDIDQYLNIMSLMNIIPLLIQFSIISDFPLCFMNLFPDLKILFRFLYSFFHYI
jgi:hypothetical protein